MGSRTAISAGVLAVALAAVPVGAPAASAAVRDCTRDGGLLSGVTNTLCDVVDAVTGTVDTLTGGVTDPVTDGVDKATDEVLGRVGEAVPTTKATPSTAATTTSSPRPSTTSSSPRPTGTGLVPETLGNVCLPVLACEDQGVVGKITPRPTPPSATPGAVRTGRGWESTATVPAVPRTTQPESRPQTVDTGAPVEEKKTAHAEEPRVDLLWPNPFAHELAVPMQDQRVVRPTPPASDVLGTVLTIALLGSAVLATRIVQQRRQRNEPADSIPFEPARAGNGRHRLA
ncbi:unnamed protein product [[Actinomadura] parvosata subsp. kistnae]|uniref:hypothetical protein n=1 Tax=[Actinomadura] parvosata TaxID=1955412 RepID=UPI000D298AB1|nr:hypothetical protein [Nonomuraea sp. ATCC 55076]SPL87491.1 unnamed protein product [Actinomadura parvosata subsp. kistnae]